MFQLKFAALLDHPVSWIISLCQTQDACSSQPTNKDHYRWCFLKLHTRKKRRQSFVHCGVQRSKWALKMKVMKIHLKNSNVRNLPSLIAHTFSLPTHTHAAEKVSANFRWNSEHPLTCASHMTFWLLSSFWLSPSTHASNGERTNRCWLHVITITLLVACISLHPHLVA